MSMNTAGFKELLEKFYSETISEEDKMVLQQWLHHPEKRADLEALFNEDLNDTAAPQMQDAELLNLMYQQIQLQIQPQQAVVRRLRWPRIAAAVAVLLAVAGLWLWFSSGTKVAVPEEPSLVNQPKDIDAPKESRAMLTLADGRVIPLDSMQNGSVAQDGNASIEKSNGQLQYTSNGSNQAITYNTLTVPKGSKPVHLVLADGSNVWLNVASSIRYPTVYNGTKREVDISGEAYFEVAKQTNSNTYPVSKVPFIVTIRAGSVTGASKGQVEVLGTRFNINAYDDEAMVSTSLVEGSVQLTPAPAAFQPAILKPGEQAQFAADQRISISRPDMDAVLAWKNGQFSFNSQNLPQIMRQLARWYNLDVVFEDQITDSYTINVSRDMPVSQLIRYIQLSGGARLTLNGNRITVTRAQ